MQIPAETAEALLQAFGVSRATRAYDRWRKPQGFDLADFDEVLFESPAVIVLDWRCCLADEASDFAAAFERCGFPLVFEELDDESLVLRSHDGSTRPIPAGQADDSDLEAAFREIQKCLPEGIEIRRSPENEGSDTSVFAVLRRSDWDVAEGVAPEVVAHFFCQLSQAES